MTNSLLQLYNEYLNAVEQTIPRAIKGQNRAQHELLLINLIDKINKQIRVVEMRELNSFSLTIKDIEMLKTELLHRDHPEEFLPRTNEVTQARLNIYEYFKLREKENHLDSSE